MWRSAEISPCGVYRYTLSREWDNGAAQLCIVMLNPSTADGLEDDPTIRRCVGFARREGFGSIVVVNLAAFRATRPSDMFAAADPVGPGNDGHVWNAAKASSKVLVAWGAARVPLMAGHMVATLAEAGHDTLYCLGTNANGSPKHPLYIKADQPFIVWNSNV